MSIARDDFAAACRSLHAAFHTLNNEARWEDVKILEDYGTTYLRITRKLKESDDSWADSPNNENEDDEVDEPDGEALQHPGKRPEDVSIVYDIIHSPTFQVPVLYLTVQPFQPLNGSSKRPPSVDEVYALLTPTMHRSGMQSVGVMGALSMTDHPISGLPVYFGHPCRTGQAMSQILAGRKDVSAEEWVLMWFGLVGGAVGLDVPVEVAEAMTSSCRKIRAEA